MCDKESDIYKSESVNIQGGVYWLVKQLFINHHRVRGQTNQVGSCDGGL